MKNMFCGFLISAFALLAGCSEEPVSLTETADMSAAELIADFTEAFRAAWADGDAQAMGRLFEEDAIRIVSTSASPIYGRDAIVREFASNDFGADESTTINATTEVAKFVSDDIVLGAGTYNILDSDGVAIVSGLWGNAFRLRAGSLLMLMESAGDLSVSGMSAASLAVPQKIDPIYSGPRAGALNQIVTTYEENNVSNPNAVAELFVNDGIHVISGNGRVIVGKENIRESLSSGAVDGVSLDAWSYGYRDVGDSLALGWGGYNLKDAAGQVIEYGMWGNVNRITEDGDRILMERAGPFSLQ